MKYYHLLSTLIIVFVITLPVHAQNKKKKSNSESSHVLLPSELMMTYRVPLQNKDMPEYVKDVSFRKKFMETILDKVLSEEIQVYENLIIFHDNNYPYNLSERKNPLLTLPQLKAAMGAFIDTVYMENFETGELEVHLVKYEIDRNEIKSVIFNEEWYFDEKNFKLEKRIIGITPVRHYYAESFFLSYVFTLIFDEFQSKKERKEFDNRKVLVKKIKYEFNMNEDKFEDIEDKKYRELKTCNTILQEANYSDCVVEREGCPFWSSYSREKFIDIIFNKVSSGEVKAYDPFSNNLLSVSEIEAIMFLRDTMFIENFETGELEELIMINEIYCSDIKSVIFIEEWYIDDKTLRMEKKVIGLTLLKESYDEVGNMRGYEALYTVYFDGANEPE